MSSSYRNYHDGFVVAWCMDVVYWVGFDGDAFILSIQWMFAIATIVWINKYNKWKWIIYLVCKCVCVLVVGVIYAKFHKTKIFASHIDHWRLNSIISVFSVFFCCCYCRCCLVFSSSFKYKKDHVYNYAHMIGSKYNMNTGSQYMVHLCILRHRI